MAVCEEGRRIKRGTIKKEGREGKGREGMAGPFGLLFGKLMDLPLRRFASFLPHLRRTNTRIVSPLPAPIALLLFSAGGDGWPSSCKKAMLFAPLHGVVALGGLALGLLLLLTRFLVVPCVFGLTVLQFSRNSPSPSLLRIPVSQPQL